MEGKNLTSPNEVAVADDAEKLMVERSENDDNDS
jgi:hypothetical protein